MHIQSSSQLESLDSSSPVTESLLLLSSYSRFSNQREKNFLAFRRDEEERIIVAATNNSKGYKPSWYLNIKEEPLVQFEIVGQRIHARASILTRKERIRVWSKIGEISPANQQPMLRNTAVVLLTPICTAD